MNNASSTFAAAGKIGFGTGVVGFGLAAPYGGAFNNSGIPDRASSASGNELSAVSFQIFKISIEILRA